LVCCLADCSYFLDAEEVHLNFDGSLILVHQFKLFKLPP
jgi:hypothetical protein